MIIWSKIQHICEKNNLLVYKKMERDGDALLSTEGF